MFATFAVFVKALWAELLLGTTFPQASGGRSAQHDGHGTYAWAVPDFRVVMKLVRKRNHGRVLGNEEVAHLETRRGGMITPMIGPMHPPPSHPLPMLPHT